jgi:hypothetical protein
VVAKGTPVPCTPVGGPPATIGDGIPEPIRFPLSSASEGTSPCVILSSRCGEASSTSRPICSRIPVPGAAVSEPSATTVDEISCPSEISISSATGMSDGTNLFVLVSGCHGETISAFCCSALVEGVSPSTLSSVKYDEASSVVRGSERAECATAGYDEAPSVVPRSELGDKSNHRVRSSCRLRPSDVRLRSAGGVDAGRRVNASSRTTELSS